MTIATRIPLLTVLGICLFPWAAQAQEKPIVGLIPKAQKPIKMDGKLDGWDGAFVTPVHVGHPDFANRGGQFLFLWDEQNLYIGLRCLDQHPAHIGTDNQIWNGDAVEFYLDTRRGDQLGAAQFSPGSLHMFWTPFTKTDVKPRMQVRDLPVFKNFKLQGAEVAGTRTAWGYTAEFKLPWANFPNFAPKVGEVIGIDCELCSSDGGPRVDRTFVYSSPAAVSTPAAFGRVQLVDKLDPQALKPLGRALLPLSLTKSANYAWLYGTVCVSPSISGSVAKLQGKILDKEGKVRKATTGTLKTLEGSNFTLWSGSWELFDLPPGIYTLELTALDKEGRTITSRTEKLLHGDPSTPGPGPASQAQPLQAQPQSINPKLRFSLNGNSPVGALAFSPDSQTLASGPLENPVSTPPTCDVQLWDVGTKKNVTLGSGVGTWEKPVIALTFYSDQKTLVSTTRDGTIKLWDVVQRKNVATYQVPAKASRVVPSRDSKTLAAVSRDNTIKLWDVVQRENTITIQPNVDHVHAVTFSPDGKILAAGSYEKIQLWDVATGKQIATLQGQSDPVQVLAFSPDGKRLAAGSQDKTIDLWDVAGRKKTATLKGHNSTVWCVAFSPDGRTLASGGSDTTVRLWDAATGKNIATLTEHSQKTEAVAFSPNGKLLATCCSGEIKVWDMIAG
jgi:WD40 repeat protein